MIKGRRNIDFPSALYYNHRAGDCPEQSYRQMPEDKKNIQEE